MIFLLSAYLYKFQLKRINKMAMVLKRSWCYILLISLFSKVSPGANTLK